MTLNLLSAYLGACPSRGSLALGDPAASEGLARLASLAAKARAAEALYLRACDPTMPYSLYHAAQVMWQSADWVLSEYLLTGRDMSDDCVAYETMSTFEGAA